MAGDAELATRWVPWEQREFSRARNRPTAERPPLPKAGERVWYRRYDWCRTPAGEHEDPEMCRVVEVQDPTDTTPTCYLPDVGPVRDLNLWHLMRDNLTGRPRLTPAGDLLYVPVADPWPWVRLQRDNGLIAETREARLRGSAGWLPLDYEHRPERWRLPSQTLTIPSP